MVVLSPYKIEVRIQSVSGYASELEDDSGDDVIRRIRQESNEDESWAEIDVECIDIIRTKRGRRPKGQINSQYEILLKSGGSILLHESEDVEEVKAFWAEATEYPLQKQTDETTPPTEN